jgi:threonine dehydrogenase-like Zn-dependent dehydrogenase
LFESAAMRALTLDGSGLNLRRDYPEPLRTEGESLVRVTTAGICGTDLELARGYMDYHGVPGHEFVGVVADSDDRALIGKRVVGEINAACGGCSFCQADLGRHCPHRTVLGILGRDGAFADYLTLPDRNLIPIPRSLPDEVAVFAEPVAAAYEIFDQIELAITDAILILGDGRLGAIVALVFQDAGFVPVVGGHHRPKLAHLARLGLKVELEENLKPGFDRVIDCTGSAHGFIRAIELVRPRGTIILKSTAAGPVPLNLAPVVINEINVIGSRCGRFAPAISAIESGRVDPHHLISGSYAFDDAIAAVAAAGDPANFKLLLQIA